MSTQVNVLYTVCEVLVATGAVVGNALVVLAFRKERKLRRRTNYYIVSLAVADLLVGLLGIPCALMASVGFPKQRHACLFTTSLLVVLCTISIFCLVAVSVDRYWAILYPMGYSRNVRTKTAIGIICVCWVAGSFVGFLPLMGWNSAPSGDLEDCLFTKVMSHQFLVFLYFATIIFPAILMAGFYAHIYTVVLKQLKQMVTVNGTSINGGGSMLRVLGAARKREVKATQNLSIIVLFFMICWIPLYTINFYEAFFDKKLPIGWTDTCIILSHLNSAGNPLLYAYHLRDFRAALRTLLCGPVTDKQIGRENTGYIPESTRRNDRLRNITSAAYLYRQQNNFKCQRRSQTAPTFSVNDTALPRLFNNPEDKYELTPKLPHRIFDLNLDCTLETNVTGLDETKIINKILDIRNSLESTFTHDSKDVTSTEESPMGFMDEHKHSIYGLGLVSETPSSPELNGKIYAFPLNVSLSVSPDFKVETSTILVENNLPV